MNEKDNKRYKTGGVIAGELFYKEALRFTKVLQQYFHASGIYVVSTYDYISFATLFFL